MWIGEELDGYKPEAGCEWDGEKAMATDDVMCGLNTSYIITVSLSCVADGHQRIPSASHLYCITCAT